MAYDEQESDCETFRLELLSIYDRPRVAGKVGIKKRLTKHSEIASEARRNILQDRVRAAYREATMEVFPGDPTCVDPADARHIITEVGLSGRVRECTADEIGVLKEKLVEEIRAMEVVMNDGRPLAVRLRLKA